MVKSIPWNAISHSEFEELAYFLLGKEGFYNLKWIGSGGGDRGRDIIGNTYEEPITRQKIERKWVIQCKHLTTRLPKSKVKEDLAKADQHHPDYWLLFTNISLTSDEIDWLNSVNENYHFKIIVLSELELTILLNIHQDIRKDFFSIPIDDYIEGIKEKGVVSPSEKEGFGLDDIMDDDEYILGKIQNATEEETNLLISKINEAPNRLAKLSAIHDLQILCGIKHVGQHKILCDIFEPIPKESDQEVRRELTRCIYLILFFETRMGGDKSVVANLKEHFLEMLYSISMSDPDILVRKEAVEAITLLIHDKKAIDYLLSIFQLEDNIWNPLKGPWQFNLYGIAKSEHKKYFLDEIEKLISSSNEKISERAYDMLRRLKSEHWQWFGD